MRQTQEEVLKVCDLRASALREENVRGGEAAVRQAAVVEELEADERLPRPQPEVTEGDGRGPSPTAAVAVLSKESLSRFGVGDGVAHRAARHHAPYEETPCAAELAGL